VAVDDDQDGTLTETQRRGLRAAGHLVRGLAAAAERQDPSSAAREPAGVGFVEAMTELAVDALRALSQPPGERDGAGTAGRAVTPDVARPAIGRPVTVWLHNTTTEEQRDLRLFCSELLNHDGGRLHARVVFTPAVTERLAAATSQAVTVAVEPAERTDPPGTYRGTILVTGRSNAWLAVEVAVPG
jgi:hypothetical protein